MHDLCFWALDKAAKELCGLLSVCCGHIPSYSWAEPLPYLAMACQLQCRAMRDVPVPKTILCGASDLRDVRN